MSQLESQLKTALNTDSLTPIGGGGGCISSGTAFELADGTRIYVKCNGRKEVSHPILVIHLFTNFHHDATFFLVMVELCYIRYPAALRTFIGGKLW